ncbi:unnamed protein product [Symbiodinium sp. CCMP2592]|nr:unnamed protein product [Symbiodinium sp. CCMP2592]
MSHEEGSAAPEEAEEPLHDAEVPAAEAEEADTPEPPSSGGKRAKRKLRRKKTRRLVLRGDDEADQGYGVGHVDDGVGSGHEKPSHGGEELGVELGKPSHDGEELGVELEKPMGRVDSPSRLHGSQEDAQNPWATSSTPTKAPKATPGSRSRRKAKGLTGFTPKSATPRKSLLLSFDGAAQGPCALSQTLQLPDEEAPGHLDAGYHSLLEATLREFDEEDEDCYMVGADGYDGSPLKNFKVLKPIKAEEPGHDDDEITPTEDKKSKLDLDNLSKTDLSRLEVLIECGEDKELFKQQVVHTFQQERSNEFKVKSGFYTDEMMEKILNFSASRRKAVRKFCLRKENRKTHVKDKYEKKLKWFWADVGYEGTLTETDREKLTRETEIASGSKVAKVPLGLSRSQPLRPDAAASSESEDDVDEDDSEDESSEEESDSDGAGAKSAKPTKGKEKKKRKKEEEKDDDDDEVLSWVLEHMQASKLKQHNADLSKQHDELADFKAAHDSDGKVSELINSINKTSRMTMEENKINKYCTLSQRSIESLGSKSSASVSHELATELAQAVVSEVEGAFGDEAAGMLQSSKLLLEMSRGYSTGHAASVTRKALDSMPEVQVPLPVTLVDVGLPECHPCILFSDYFRLLAERGSLETLTTGADLQSFWDKMQPLKPNHPVYKLPAADRAFTVPMYLIGDEGRGFKKSAVMVLGSESVLGQGCEAEDEQTAQDELRMNFRGNTLLTRQLFAVMPKKKYQKDSTPLRRLVDAWAEDLGKCFTTGLEIRSGGSVQTWRIATLGLKADWPALSKLGLTRMIPMEMDKKPLFYMIDLFHTFHKGITLWDLKVTGCTATGLDKNLSYLFDDMKAFSQANNLYLHMCNLTKSLLGISSAADFPYGAWFKGADTTFVIKYLLWKFQDVLEKHELQDSDSRYLSDILSCLRSADGFMSSLYRGSLFLGPRSLPKVVRLGRSMVHMYAKIASLAYERGLARYKLNPKFHMLLHIILQLRLDLHANREALSPISHSCQMAEDVINRIATLGRACAPRMVAERTLYLYKVELARLL